ncbi:MAG: DUF4296 domain-containing protein [Cyclobacteriaceae bacterium]|jgi:hypothetical protein|nr:DUF4296 domain-containing protein [Cyclobacteriaceae bacterium]
MSILEPFSVYRTVNLTKGVTEMMRRLKYLAIVVLIALVQCKQEQKPPHLLNEEEMVTMLVDLYLAEAKVTLTGIRRDSANKLFHPYEESIIASRGITDSTLNESYNYYFQHPDELEKILDAVMDTLNLREQRASDKP